MNCLDLGIKLKRQWLSQIITQDSNKPLGLLNLLEDQTKTDSKIVYRLSFWLQHEKLCT